MILSLTVNTRNTRRSCER